jgi:hypothetical protein
MGTSTMHQCTRAYTRLHIQAHRWRISEIDVDVSQDEGASRDTEPAAAAPTPEEYQLLCSLLAAAPTGAGAVSGRRKARAGRGGALSFSVDDGE